MPNHDPYSSLTLPPLTLAADGDSPTLFLVVLILTLVVVTLTIVVVVVTDSCDGDSDSNDGGLLWWLTMTPSDSYGGDFDACGDD